jgi:heptosyltransferase I
LRLRIRILKPSSLGDVVHALPVLRLIKQAHPRAEIYWWILEELAPLLADDPDISELFLFERKNWNRLDFWPRKISQIRRMRRLRFDWVIDLQGLARSGSLAWLANGALTVGLDDTREGASGFYDIRIPRPSFGTHAVDWYLQMLPALQVPVHNHFEWLPPRKLSANSPAWEIGPGKRIVLNPGARWENKRWPTEYFGQLAVLLSQNYPAAQIIVLGGKADAEAGKIIQAAAPAHVRNLTGKTTIPAMVELIRGCDVMVTNDTGPMHIAAALKKPLIPLFGPTDPRRTGPYGQVDRVFQQRDLSCVPCMSSRCRNKIHMECLTSIPAQSMFLAVSYWLDTHHKATPQTLLRNPLIRLELTPATL